MCNLARHSICVIKIMKIDIYRIYIQNKEVSAILQLRSILGNYNLMPPIQHLSPETLYFSRKTTWTVIHPHTHLIFIQFITNAENSERKPRYRIYTQEVLAEKIGKSVNFLSQIEGTGIVRGISLETLFKIADVLGIPPAKLLEDD